MLAFSILRMVIVRIPEDHGWVPAYPTSGTAIEFQFLSPFVIVSFLKVRVRARAQGGVGSESVARHGTASGVPRLVFGTPEFWAAAIYLI